MTSYIIALFFYFSFSKFTICHVPFSYLQTAYHLHKKGADYKTIHSLIGTFSILDNC